MITKPDPIVVEIGRSAITRIKPGAGSAKLVPAKAGSGNPEIFVIEVDSRFLPAFAGMTGFPGARSRFDRSHVHPAGVRLVDGATFPEPAPDLIGVMADLSIYAAIG